MSSPAKQTLAQRKGRLPTDADIQALKKDGCSVYQVVDTDNGPWSWVCGVVTPPEDFPLRSTSAQAWQDCWEYSRGVTPYPRRRDWAHLDSDSQA